MLQWVLGILWSKFRMFAQAIFILNLVSVLFGITYLLYPVYSIAWDVFGVILLITFFGDLLFIYLLDGVLNKNISAGNRLNWTCYGFLIAIILGMIGMFLGNTFSSGSYSNSFGLANVVTTISFFSIEIFGMIIATWTIRVHPFNSEWQLSSKSAHKSPPYRWFRIFILAIIFLLILVMGCLAILTLAGGPIGPLTYGTILWMSGLIGVYAAAFGGFWVFITLSLTIFFLKVSRRFSHRRLAMAIGVIGLIISLILFVPMVATPFAASTADQEMNNAFSPNWNKVSSNVTPYFLPSRVNVPAYYLGIPAENCQEIINVSFYNGTAGVDAGLQLYFDAYLPPNQGIGLPGQNSTLIRIHGGAWTISDKGFSNTLQLNKYFAAQGYCVFDIQYGLNNQSTFISGAESVTPQNVKGNFTINDMVRHIGIFCKFLTANHAEYGANISSVFIEGDSAGGQLTCASALAIASGNYTSLFGTGLTIRGFIPVYPANGMRNSTALVGVYSIDNNASLPEFYDPTLLVTANSPPCLVFQGTQDGLVNPIIALTFQSAYKDQENQACAVIMMPFANHGFYVYFPDYYTHFLIYYMERFLYLYR